MSAVLTGLLVIACAACTLAQLGPVYTLQANIPGQPDNSEDQRAMNLTGERPFTFFSDQQYYEWEGYDGWFNNPAHPEWGGAGKYSHGTSSHLLECFFFFHTNWFFHMWCFFFGVFLQVMFNSNYYGFCLQL